MVRVALLWVGLNLGILALLAVVDGLLFVRGSLRKVSGRRKGLSGQEAEAEASAA